MLKNFYINGIYMYFICNYGQTNIQEVVVKMKNFFKSRFSKERLAKFFDREGFYIVLFLCVCIVAVTAVWVSRTGLKEDRSENIGKVDDNKTIVNTPVTPSETSTDEDEDTMVPAADDADVADSGDKTGSEGNTAPVVAKNTVSKTAGAFKIGNPLDLESGDIALIRDYSPEELVCFEYLNEWKTHLGIDIKGYEGSEVAAVDDGKVVEIRDDNEYPGGLGWMVIIDHNNGYRSVYANLSEEISLKKNQSVEKGQKIGVIGSSSIYEKHVPTNSNEDLGSSHLHFELLKKNAANTYENVDPKEYFSMQD